VARPERLELPTYWFEASNSPIISDLEAGIDVAIHSQSLLVFVQFGASELGTLAGMGEASMQGVGTILGAGDKEMALSA